MIITSPYSYEKLDRITDSDGSRVYICPKTGQPLPSVTTILDKTKDKTALKEWINWVGEKKATQIKDEASGLGTLVHTHIENHIQKMPRPGGNNLIRLEAARMADIIIEKGLCNVSEVWGMEVALYFPELFAGTTDLIAKYNGKPSILDHKSSKKIKDINCDQMTDYLIQCSAYALAHNYLYNTDISQIVIFMVSRTLEFEAFVVEGNDFFKYASMWQERLIQYSSKS